MCFKLAQAEPFRLYQAQVRANARTLADALTRLGFRLVSGGTDTHLALIDLTGQGVTGKEAQDLLEDVGVVVNKNAIPFDPEYLGSEKATQRVAGRASGWPNFAALFHCTLTGSALYHERAPGRVLTIAAHGLIVSGFE